MLKTLLPTPSQQSAIAGIVVEDIDRRPFGHPISVPTGFHSSVELLVSGRIQGPVDGDIFHGIPDSPAVPMLGGRITLAEGSMAVRSALAESLSRAISANEQVVLLVPHAYALPKEVESLQSRYGGNMAIFSDNVYVAFSADCADSQIIRRALARMIGAYSVAWIFNDAEVLAQPVAAVVSVFDGDGFALVGRSVTRGSSLLSDIARPISH